MPKVFLKRLVLWDLLLSLIWLITLKEFLRDNSSPTCSLSSSSSISLFKSYRRVLYLLHLPFLSSKVIVVFSIFFIFHFSLQKSPSNICNNGMQHGNSDLELQYHCKYSARCGMKMDLLKYSFSIQKQNSTVFKQYNHPNSIRCFLSLTLGAC